ncbi:MAG: 4Fe-4S dicluster domain-containing protein, partial [Elusimicrobiota bacterium]
RKLFIIEKNNLKKLLKNLIGKFNVIALVLIQGNIRYQELDDISQIDEMLKNGLCDRPLNTLKEFYFPQKNLISSVKKEGKSKQKKTVFFMVLPCDIKAIEYFDMFYLTGGMPDPFYSDFRKNLFIIGLNCDKFCEKGFCDLVGSGPAATSGYDMLLTDLEGGKYFLELSNADSSKGKELLNYAVSGKKKLYTPAAHSDFVLRQKKTLIKRELKSPLIPLFQRGKSLNEVDRKISRISKAPSDFENDFKNTPPELWEGTAKNCLKCGGCCFVCPTCTCFQVVDTLEKGVPVKYRVWDSCRFAGFTRLAAGFNPREEMSERIKRRVFCKFVYSLKNSGIISCVGCGRCDDVCYTDIEIQKTLRKVYQNA